MSKLLRMLDVIFIHYIQTPVASLHLKLLAASSVNLTEPSEAPSDLLSTLSGKTLLYVNHRDEVCFRLDIWRIFTRVQP